MGPEAGQAQKIAQDNGIYHQDWRTNDNPRPKRRPGMSPPPRHWRVHDIPWFCSELR